MSKSTVKATREDTLKLVALLENLEDRVPGNSTEELNVNFVKELERLFGKDHALVIEARGHFLDDAKPVVSEELDKFARKDNDDASTIEQVAARQDKLEATAKAQDGNLKNTQIAQELVKRLKEIAAVTGVTRAERADFAHAYYTGAFALYQLLNLKDGGDKQFAEHLSTNAIHSLYTAAKQKARKAA